MLKGGEKRFSLPFSIRVLLSTETEEQTKRGRPGNEATVDAGLDWCRSLCRLLHHPRHYVLFRQTIRIGSPLHMKSTKTVIIRINVFPQWIQTGEWMARGWRTSPMDGARTGRQLQVLFRATCHRQASKLSFCSLCWWHCHSHTSATFVGLVTNWWTKDNNYPNIWITGSMLTYSCILPVKHFCFSAIKIECTVNIGIEYGCDISLVPRCSVIGERSAWYPLFAHAWLPRFLWGTWILLY